MKIVRPLAFPWAAPTWPATVERPPPKATTGTAFETGWARRYPARLARALVLDSVGKALVEVLAAPRISGLDRLAGLEGPVIFAANHASHVDTPLLLTALPDRFRHRTVVAAGADYFFDTRWKGVFWAFAINAIPVERLKASPRSTRLAAQMLDEGWSLLIFPEGGRSPHGWAQPHRPGAAFLSTRARVPVVPIHIEGTRRILRKGTGRITPSITTVTFGAPVHATEGEDPRSLARRVDQAITVLADEQANGWWPARRRAAAGETPALTGPEAADWRRFWALGEGRRAARPRLPRWP